LVESAVTPDGLAVASTGFSSTLTASSGGPPAEAGIRLLSQMLGRWRKRAASHDEYGLVPGTHVATADLSYLYRYLYMMSPLR
jgi:hypothetical protein